MRHKSPHFGFELEGDPPTEADSGRTCARLIEPRFPPGLLLSCNARKEIADALSLARQQLFALMFIPHMDDRLNELAALAEPEEWDYHRTETDNQKPILYNYLRYTYQRLTEEEKIVVSDDGQYTFQKLIGSSSGALGRRRDRRTARPEY